MPECTYGAGVAMLHNTPDEQLHIIGGNGAVEIRGEVIPKGFILAGIAVAGFLRCPRLNAVADITVIRIERADNCEVGRPKKPTVHKLEFGMSPLAAVIEIGIAISRERDEIDFRLLSCGKGGSQVR